jgi:redox-sensitive bicupin YhaK (pirin superfamily)
MPTQTEARIYLESLRGQFQTAYFRSLRTFNCEGYLAEGRAAFGDLMVFNDETLLPDRSHSIVVGDDCEVVLLPMVGGIEVKDNTEHARFVDSGEALIFTARRGGIYEITNPYEEEAVNFLHIRMKCRADTATPPFVTKFDLTKRNTLFTIYSEANGAGSIHIGKYEGREEGVLINDNPNQGIFVFVIEGVFEVQNRLLEKRDGLSVSFADEIEFEALSNDAVILLLEV